MGNQITKFDHTLDYSRWREMNCKKVWKHMKQLGSNSINKNINMTRYILKKCGKRIDIYVKGLDLSLWDLMDYENVLNNMSKSDIEEDSLMVTYIYKQNISIKRYIWYLESEYYCYMDNSKVWKDMCDEDYNKNNLLIIYLINCRNIYGFSTGYVNTIRYDRLIKRFIPNLRKSLWMYMDRNYIYNNTSLQDMNKYPKLLQYIIDEIPLKDLKGCRNLDRSLFEKVKCCYSGFDSFLFLFENNIEFVEYITNNGNRTVWSICGEDYYIRFILQIEKFHYNLPRAAWKYMNRHLVWKAMGKSIKKINHNVEFTKYVLGESKITFYHRDLHKDLWEVTSVRVWEKFVNGKNIEYIESILKRTRRKIKHYNPTMNIRLLKYMDIKYVLDQSKMTPYRHVIKRCLTLNIIRHVLKYNLPKAFLYSLLKIIHSSF